MQKQWISASYQRLFSWAWWRCQSGFHSRRLCLAHNRWLHVRYNVWWRLVHNGCLCLKQCMCLGDKIGGVCLVYISFAFTRCLYYVFSWFGSSQIYSRCLVYNIWLSLVYNRSWLNLISRRRRIDNQSELWLLVLADRQLELWWSGGLQIITVLDALMILELATKDCRHRL